VQFCYIVKQHRQQKSVYRAISILLVALIFSMFAVPVVHAHHSESAARSTEKNTVAASNKCLTCSFLSHQKYQEYLISLDCLLVAPVRTYITLLHKVVAGIPKSTLQGFTNKGPPLFFNVCYQII
jgi:hypothetical protein